MKQKLTPIIIVLCAFSFIYPKALKSQTTKGNWLTEGNIGNITLSNDKNQAIVDGKVYKNGDQSYSAVLFPRIGYFVANNIVIGLSINIGAKRFASQSYWENGIKSNEGVSKTVSGGLSPFVRYYINSKNPKNKFYVQADGGFNVNLYNESTSTSYSETGEIYGTSLSHSDGQVVSGEFLIGFNHFFTDNIAFNAALGYNYNRRTSTYNANNTYAGNTIVYPGAKNRDETNAFVWNFGFTILLNRKKQN